ncbi:hypothetical protein DFH11DRAFT_1609582 [Phellopilus nigrolimitatus]|nr:hypothetical protein DFH11DRAFT_1609582 [Phellopilus nigrolimitatus]
MSSSTSSASKEELKRQIAALQAQLSGQPESPPAKKRRTNEATILAPATPSPRKNVDARRDRAQSPTNFTRRAQQLAKPIPPLKSGSKSKANPQRVPAAHEPAPSTLVSQLKSLNPCKKEDREPIARTEGFAEKPVPLPPITGAAANVPVRDDRLAIVEELEMGPAEHKPIPDDPHFEKVEPNSGIRLKSRVLPHSALQDHLFGRYFLPPSLLYSVVRLQPNKQAYEVPVEGDWVTIAVVAERGDVKFTSGPGNSAHGKRSEEDGLDDGNGKDKKKRKKEEDDEDEENPRKGGKKYVHIKLIDLGHRSRSSTSAAPRASLRGDAQLSLLLFESDYFDKLVSKDGGKEKMQKIWRGGSGGAFEECFSKLREGAVVALLNPKVLKPFQNTKNPASSSILALTPPSSSAINIIGYASDLGMCGVRRRDGKPCGAWVDRRSNPTSASGKGADDVCEYHLQAAVQRARAGRAEFSIGTSGMTTTANKRRAAYDPARQWGLKPETGLRGHDGEATYVIGGHVASSSRAQAPGVAGETMGREGQARARRRVAEREGDRELAELLGKGGSGTSGGGSREALAVVKKAREAVLKGKGQGKGKEKGKGKSLPADMEDEENEDVSRSEQSEPKKKSFSAEMVKRLGFDPTIKAYAHPASFGKGGAKNKDTVMLGNQKREIRLGAPPGKKVRSGVIAPTPSIINQSDDGHSESGEAAKASQFDGADSGRTKGAEGTSQISAPSADIAVANDLDSDLEIEPPIPIQVQGAAAVKEGDEL